MAKICSTIVLANACTIIRDNVTRITINTGTPPTSTLAETTSIGTATASAASFTLGDSSLTGKKLDVIAFTNIPCPTSTGTAGTLCLISTGAGGVIYWQTTFAEQLVASTANLINTSTFIIRISDAT